LKTEGRGEKREWEGKEKEEGEDGEEEEEGKAEKWPYRCVVLSAHLA